jgi:hypothetical protein
MTERDRNKQGQRAGKAPNEADHDGTGQDSTDLDSLARDWITLWQSEIAALAHDREAAETVARMAGIWAGLAASLLGAVPPAHEPAAAPHAATAPAAPRAAPAHAAPDAGMAALHGLLGDLAERLEGIERRLAALERRNGAADRARPGKRRAKPGR